MSMIRVSDFARGRGWLDAGTAAQRATESCRQLEEGNVIFFDAAPFDLSDDDRAFLLSQKQSDFKGHKNISYRPTRDVLRGAAGAPPQDEQRLHGVMRNFSREVTGFLGKFLAPYASKWKLDFASFRPLQEMGRDLSLHKRNDLLHVDAFPSRPTNGGRILRVFININPTESRVWQTTDGFKPLIDKYGDDVDVRRFASAGRSPVRKIGKTFAPVLRSIGLRTAGRSSYDRFMLRFHDYLKENSDYQQNYPKVRMEFPPGSSWMVYTDLVPHAAMSGQYALEQTYIIPVETMVAPEKCPLKLLESHAGMAMAN